MTLYNTKCSRQFFAVLAAAELLHHGARHLITTAFERIIKLLNFENYQPYSSMLGINVLYLNRTELATDEDKANKLVYWAELFKAKTWEDLKALIKQNPSFEEVATVMYNSNIQSEEKTIMQAHQRFRDYQRAMYNNGYV